MRSPIAFCAFYRHQKRPAYDDPLDFVHIGVAGPFVVDLKHRGALRDAGAVGIDVIDELDPLSDSP